MKLFQPVLFLVVTRVGDFVGEVRRVLVMSASRGYINGYCAHFLRNSATAVFCLNKRAYCGLEWTSVVLGKL